MSPRPVAGLLLCALSLLLVAPAQAQESPATLQMRFAGPERLEVEVESEATGDLARAQRARMDADKDGNVSEEEAQAGAAAQRALFDGRRLGLPVGRVYLDGQENTAGALEQVDYHGAAGPVDANGSLVTVWRLVLTWPENASATPAPHLFEIDTANRSVGGYLRVTPAFVLLEAPPGFVVGDTGGLPFGADVEGRRVLMPTGLPREGWVRIAFDPAPEEDTPLPLPLALAGLLAAAFRRPRGLA